jgi:hypothetical protein
MSEIAATVPGKLDLEQALELSLLVDLEARWENLRKAPGDASEEGSSRDLPAKQHAYEVFRAKLAAYNRRYTPLHVPELLLNTPGRLALWCRKILDLYLRLEHNPQARCPVHLLAKAYRWADRVAARLHKDLASPPGPPTSIRGAVAELEELVRWCESAVPVPPLG